MTDEPTRQRRILLRSGKSPFDVASLEQSLDRDVFATNAGNLIFSDAAHKLLTTPRAEVFSNGIRTDPSAAARINEEFDVFVVPLANAFRPTFERPLKRMTQLIKKLRIPVVVLGVGAQADLKYDAARLKPMEPTVREFVTEVLNRSASIGVRGEFTEQYLKNMGFRDVEVIGCPSMFMNGETFQLEKKSEELTAESLISVNGSHSAVRSHGLDAIIRQAHERYPNLRFVGQNLLEAQLLHWRETSNPIGAQTSMPTHPSHPMYREGKVRLYVDPLTWIEELRAFDFSFGSRIHGNIAALLAGVPSTVLCSDSRTLELCRYFGIPHRKISETPSDIDPAELYEAADFGELVNGHKERFLRFTGFMEKNGLENTFHHGDSGRAFDAQVSKLALPPAVRPWTESDPDSLSSRFSWMQSRMAELSAQNAQLRSQLEKKTGPVSIKVQASDGAAAWPSAYRRARRVVGRPVRRLLRPEQ
ncbi:polysaccharide pyruvyl transferase family protein [Streptomyces sp. JH34]|uniref:polysaccharide pyruvyl transferase family protein n=1 Tax=Streptomyces sp. JH34 TaxID=2793633 RepID=UPI0023F94EE4|nr:polysaccharide pyruvyl transferase family protein [Streptomyces sp. JH34]MDF6021187.1 polysaccharide pyruvyl transferase family protein [Streptomyces sp. JH34]